MWRWTLTLVIEIGHQIGDQRFERVIDMGKPHTFEVRSVVSREAGL